MLTSILLFLFYFRVFQMHSYGRTGHVSHAIGLILCDQFIDFTHFLFLPSQFFFRTALMLSKLAFSTGDNVLSRYLRNSSLALSITCRWLTLPALDNSFSTLREPSVWTCKKSLQVAFSCNSPSTEELQADWDILKSESEKR